MFFGMTETRESIPCSFASLRLGGATVTNFVVPEDHVLRLASAAADRPRAHRAPAIRFRVPQSEAAAGQREDGPMRTPEQTDEPTARSARRSPRLLRGHRARNGVRRVRPRTLAHLQRDETRRPRAVPAEREELVEVRLDVARPTVAHLRRHVRHLDVLEPPVPRLVPGSTRRACRSGSTARARRARDVEAHRSSLHR